MPTVRLFLNKDKIRTNGYIPIHIGYFVDNGKHRYRPSTGKAIREEHWNPNNPDAPIRASYYDADNLNIFLRGRLARMNKIVDTYYSKHEEYPSPAYVESQYNPPKEDAASFEALYALFMERKHHKKKTPISQGTYINNEKVRERLREYAVYAGTKLAFEMITVPFIDQISTWMVEVRNNNPNTTGSLFKVLRTFLYWCNENHDLKFPESIIAKLPVIDDKKWFPDLDLTEIIDLAELNLNDRPEWADVRDAFIIQSGAGMRVSDLKDLLDGKKIIRKDGGYVYQFQDNKTKGLQSVPLPSFIYRILDSRFQNDVTDWMPSEDTINREIKLICAAASITEPVSIRKMVKGVYTDMEVPKWTTVTTHTARRSFINNMRRLGVHDSVIASITGQSIKTLERYMNSSRTDKREAMTKYDSAITGLTSK